MKVQTKSGIVQGCFEDQRYCFRGIPYAKAERFGAPKDTCWDGVLECVKFGPKPIQVKNREGQSEDCLNLNIYSPDLNGSLPVLVEVYGGAFQSGNNQDNDVACVMQDDRFVYVTINYRVGLLGYLYLEDCPTSGNSGTLDQIAALRWIFHNIASFGGDPERITVLGSSAGAKSLSSILYAKEGSQYFKQMILVSGAYQSIRSKETAARVTQQVKEILQEEFEEIRTLPVERILEVQEKICPPLKSTCTLGPVADGIVIAKDYLSHLSDFSWKGKVMMGSSLHELALKDMIPDFGRIAPDLAEGLFGQNAPIAMRTADDLMKVSSPEDAWGKVFSDYMYRTYTYRYARLFARMGIPVYQYSSCFTEAFHCVDFLLATHAQLPDHLQKEDLMQIGKQFHENMISFVINGEPKEKSWLPVNEENTQLIFDRRLHTESIQFSDVCDLIGEQVYL